MIRIDYRIYLASATKDAAHVRYENYVTVDGRSRPKAMAALTEAIRGVYNSQHGTTQCEVTFDPLQSKDTILSFGVRAHGAPPANGNATARFPDESNQAVRWLMLTED